MEKESSFFLNSLNAKGKISHIPLRDGFLSLIMGILIGVSFILGKNFYKSSGYINLSDIRLWIKGILIGIFFSCIILCILIIFNICSRLFLFVHSLSKKRRIHLKGIPSFYRRSLCLLLILLCWVPAYLAVFPGNYSSDAPFQLQAFLNRGYLDLHQPAAHTLILAGCFEIGNLVFKSFNVGLVIYCLIQSLLLASSMVFAADKLIEWDIPPLIVIILTLIMVFNPVVQSYAFVTTKDSFFAAFFLFTLVYMVELLRCPQDVLSNKGSLVRMALSSFGMCLMRKQSIYILIIISIIIFFKLAHIWRPKFLLLILMPIMGIFVFNSLISCTFRTVPDSIREALSVPSQQIVRVYMLNYDSLSQEQLKQISKFYDTNQLDQGRLTSAPLSNTGVGKFYDTESGFGYLDTIADPAKGSLKDKAFQSDPLGYFSMWILVAHGNENMYIEAFLWGSIGYLYPSSEVANNWSGISPWNPLAITLTSGGSENQISNYNQSSLFPAYCEWLYDGTWNIFPENFILMFWVSLALPFYVLVVVFCLLVHTRQKPLLIPWLFVFMYWLSLSLGPVVCVRYVAPFFYCIPFLMSLPFLSKTKK